MSKMVISILRMPADLFWAGDPVSRQAHESIRQLAADRIEYLEAQVEACSSRNSSDVDRIQDLETALAKAADMLEIYAVKVDGEWGDCRDAGQLYADGEMPEALTEARALLTQEEGG